MKTSRKCNTPNRTRIVTTIALCLALLLLPGLAFAFQALPYESGLKTLRDSFEGPVPMVISLAGIVGCGAMLIFGGEISGFMRTMVFIVLVVAVIVQATSIVGMLGGKIEGGSGAVASSSVIAGSRA